MITPLRVRVQLGEPGHHLANAITSGRGASYIEQVVSVEAVRRWKPAPEPYLHAVRVCGVEPAQMALVATHGWDTHGAHRAGLRTGWISRLEGHWNEMFDPPEVTGPDALTAVRRLLALQAGR